MVQAIHDPLLGCCFHILLASPGPAIPGVGIFKIVLFQRFSRLSSFKDFQHHLLSKIVEIVEIVLFQRLQFAAEVFVALAADFQFNPSKFRSVAFSTFSTQISFGHLQGSSILSDIYVYVCHEAVQQTASLKGTSHTFDAKLFLRDKWTSMSYRYIKDSLIGSRAYLVSVRC